MTSAESPGCTFRRLASVFGAGLVTGLILAAALAGAWTVWNTKDKVVAQLAPTSPKINGLEKEEKSCTRVQAFVPKAKKKLDLPELIQKDEQASVMAAASVPPSDYPRTATAVLHRDTGVGEIYLREDPRPWVGLRRRYEVGYSWLPLSDGGGEAIHRIDGRAEMLQIKAMRAGPVGEISEQAGKFRWMAGFRVWASWP